jgi:oligopeptide transport system ATP-binding protein
MSVENQGTLMANMIRQLNRSRQPLVEARNLIKHFRVGGGTIFARRAGKIRAVDGVSFSIHEGETLGLVGESGCGKSTIGRVMLRLQPATSGEVWFQGQNVHALGREDLRALRSKMQIIFQDPYSSLNPRMTVGRIIGEALAVHRNLHGKDARARITELLEAVGLSAEHISRYPHEFSGGQRQRIGVARALAVEPKLIICDEPVSALDVSVQAQVLNLLQDLKRDFGLTYLFISHDLAVVRHISDRVAVMYLGKIVELADRESIYESPLHPYTEALLQSIPIADPHARLEYKPLKGELPSAFKLPSGCRFHTRCPRVMSICKEQEPSYMDIGEGHWAACHLYEECRNSLSSGRG